MEEPVIKRGGGAGCLSAVTRCIWGRPKEDLTRYRGGERNTIEFEDLVTAENRAKATKAKQQVVTETERELVKSGNFDRLVEEQRRKDEERDAELKRQEEKLRREEEAYYAAKREAARRTRQTSPSTQQVSTEVERGPQPQPDVVIYHQPKTTPTTQPKTTPTTQSKTTPTAQPKTTHTAQQTTISELLSSSPSQEEEDFDQFLESVKARQLSITSAAPPTVSSAGGDSVVREGGEKEEEEEEEEVDFGYWEKADLPATDSPPKKTDGHTSTASPGSREMDLSLL